MLGNKIEKNMFSLGVGAKLLWCARSLTDELGQYFELYIK